YPAKEVASHIVGFTDIDDHGQEGIELAYDEWLRGSNGQKRVLKDLKGRVIKDVQLLKSAQSGEDLQLSIDLRIQYLASEELKKAIKEHEAKSGAVVVVDVHTGEILAMANYPTFNPNNRSRVKPSHLRNRAVTDVFEPGSTMKPLTIAAALESGKFTRDTVIDTNPGYIRVQGKTLYDHNNYGLLDLTGIIRKSSQVGTTKIALALDPQEVRNLFYRVGLGQATGIGFPGESVGVLPSHRKWREIERVTFAFGYGLSLTALQLADAYTVLANRGEKRQLSLLKVSEQAETEKVLSAEVTSQVLEMMQAVTQKGGTGTRASIPAFTVAGKTGTTHVQEAGGYAENKYVSVFAGIAPATNPRFVAVVMVNEPTRGGYYGGLVAAPVFREVVAGALRLVGVKPDNIKEEKKLS
ncbi:MAG: penicillin-binding protein 2, partial [Pseudomonadales bacterium]|nr:penicillin-binding protein 2 [Pseudomonadales bacterium]